MRKLLVVVAFLSLIVGPMTMSQEKPGHGDEAKHVMVRADEVKWGPGPPALPSGVEMAVLTGNPMKAGPYVARAKMPDGYRVPPHRHPCDENITVLKGTLLIGTGEKFDPSKAEELSVGSFMRMPKNMRHFAMAKGETIIQLHGVEPFEITYVNAADDPRKKN